MMNEQGFAIEMNTSAVQTQLGTQFPQDGFTLAAARPDAEARSFHGIQLLKWAVSFPAMLAASLVGRVFYQGRSFVIDPDLWWHIKTGQNILATHHWPTTDPYSFTIAGNPWLAYEWLGDVAIGFVARWGLQALDALLIALGSMVMLAIYYYATLRSGNSKAGFVPAGLLCSLAFASFNLRPQMFGYLFLVLTLIALEKFRQGRERALWFLPPLFLIWINTHGSWIIGLGVFLLTIACGLFEFQKGSVQALRWTERQRVQLELAFLASLAMLPLTPYGAELAAFPFDVAFKHPLQVASIQEWKPMPLDLPGGKLFLAIVALFFILQFIFHFTFRLEEWLLALGGAAMAFLHIRFLLLFVPFFAPLFAVMLARWIPRYDGKKDKFVINGVLISAIAAAIFWYFPSRAALERIAEQGFPVRAVNYIREHPISGPVFNAYGFGGYLIAALPEQRVFIDGRSEPYETSGVLSDYLQITELKPSAFALMEAYRIRACLLDQEQPLVTVLRQLPEWRQVYSDSTSVLFVREFAVAAGTEKQKPANKE
jgi:hypothetical protein